MIGNMSIEDTDALICELAKSHLREAIEYGYYDQALHAMSVLIEDSPDLGRLIYSDLIGYWQECYDEAVNVKLGIRKVIVMLPRCEREPEETFE